MFKRKRVESNNFDKDIEQSRYDGYAEKEMSENLFSSAENPLADIAMIHRPPFLKYYEELSAVILPQMTVLELGAGTGRHNHIFTKIGCKVIAIDVSQKSLDVYKLRNSSIETIQASIEDIPLASNSVDVIVSSGSLSYGEPSRVDSEIYRLLKPDGNLVILDSLNHNLVYKFNRYIHYLKNHRSRSTLSRIPDMKRLVAYSSQFESISIKYFGSHLWALSPLIRIFGLSTIVKVNNLLEKVIPAQRYAFKFVLTARGFRK